MQKSPRSCRLSRSTVHADIDIAAVASALLIFMINFCSPIFLLHVYSRQKFFLRFDDDDRGAQVFLAH